MSHDLSPPTPDGTPTAVDRTIDAAADPASWAPAAPGPRCPWCSALLPRADLAACPSCGAQVAGGADSGIPGLTDIAPRARPEPLEPARRNRWLAWISGEVVDDPLADPVPESGRAALAPPSRDVRREILRLQLEAAGFRAPDPGATAPIDASPDGPSALGDPDAATEAPSGPGAARPAVEAEVAGPPSAPSATDAESTAA